MESGLRLDWRGASAPFLMRTPDGRYRLYYHADSGLKSAISSDGLAFTIEPRQRIPVGDALAFDCEVLHAWGVALPKGGYRLYYTGHDCTNYKNPQLRILSAESSDGIYFRKEGFQGGVEVREQRVRIDIGSARSGLNSAGKGRVLQLADGSYRMFFAGELASPDRLPQNIMVATSPEGMAWSVDPKPLYADAFDPALVRAPDGAVKLYFATPAGFRVAEAHDGLTWPATARPIVLLDRSGAALTPDQIRAIEVFTFPDGTSRLYASFHRANLSDGIVSFVRRNP